MAGSDAEAIEAVRNGDVDRYAELVDKYQGRAIRLAFSPATPWDNLVGQTVRASVSRVRDVIGNSIPAAVEWKFTVSDMNLAAATASLFDITFDQLHGSGHQRNLAGEINGIAYFYRL